MAQKGAKQKRGISFSFRLLLCLLAVGVILMGVTLAAALHYALDSFEQGVERHLTATAGALAVSAMVHEAFLEGECSPALTAYLDELVERTADLEVITIAGADSVRLYHVVHSRIGGSFVGGDQDRVLRGESYFSDAVGTMGPQHRYFTPVLDGDGAVMGFVMVSATNDGIKALRDEIIAAYVRIAAFLSVLLVALSAGLSRLLRDTLLGFSPERLADVYFTQNNVFNNLDEGVVAADSQGRIRLVNRAAENILGRRMELLEGVFLDQLLRAKSGESLLEMKGVNIPTSRPNVLAYAVPPERGGKQADVTLILRDRGEAVRQAEQLNGTRHIISALRANSHEFMNKLQVISGLLQMGQSREALEYIDRISAVQTKSIEPIIQYIENPNVAALLLGKLDNARELEIQLTLLSTSKLPRHSAFLTSGDLVVVVGNLVENAMEAVNAQPMDSPRSIELQIAESGTGLLIMVSDTGVGIPPHVMGRIYDQGFSTKSAEGRGVGMTLIRDVVERRKGRIEADSEPGVGTTFTLIFSEKRQKEKLG